MGAAVYAAHSRGHRLLTVTHLALSLLSEPDVARELERRGVSLTDLYRDIEDLLPPAQEPPTELVPADLNPVLDGLLRRATGRWLWTARPRDVMRCLLRSEEEQVHAVLVRHAVTFDESPSAVTAPVEARSLVAESGPYRGQPKEDAEVVLWNDDTTPSRFVVRLVRETFGIGETHATRLVLSIDRYGFAAVGTYARGDAERLAATATASAREKGHPLRVSVEPAGRTKAMSRLERWYHRI